MSIHLHYRGETYGTESDRLILHLAAPVARMLVREGWAEQWFYVRYGEGGPHVRLRLKTRRALLYERLVEEIRGLSTDPAVSELVGSVEIRDVPYVPEVDRYGGAKGLAVAERLFDRCSEATVELLDRPNTLSESTRSGSAITITTVLLRAILGEIGSSVRFLRKYQEQCLNALLSDRDEVVEWRQLYAAAYKRQSPVLSAFTADVWRRLDEGSVQSGPLDRYFRGAKRAREELLALAAGGELGGCVSTREGSVAVASLLPSYLHMMNNRLGIPPHEEPYLAGLLGSALEAPAEFALVEDVRWE